MAKTPEIDLRENYGKNYIINGDMTIAQRGTSFVAISDADYCLDRWQYAKVGAAVHTVSQDSDVPSFAQSGLTFTSSLRMNLTTPDTSLAAGDYVLIGQKIEGYNFAPLYRKAFTLSFWVKATVAGTYCVSFRNAGNDKSLVKEYTVNATNTWEYKTISVDNTPSDGTWNFTNSNGLRVFFALSGGTSVQTTPNVWANGNFFCTANQVNGTNTGATDFRITGVMINEGYEALPFRLFGSSLVDELNACYRYCLVMAQPTGTYPNGTIVTSASLTDHRFFIPTPVQMRANPTATLTGSITMAVNGSAYVLSALSPSTVHPNGVKGNATTATGPGANHHAAIHLGGNTLTFSAEL